MGDGEAPFVPGGRPLGVEHFWTVGTTAMTEEEAGEAARWISKRFPSVHAFPVDPHNALTLSMDRQTVETMRAALALYASNGGEVSGMLEELEDWLRATGLE
jgi:hypothetical protein